MRAAELGGVAGRLHVQQEMDVALAIMADRLAAVRADMGEAKLAEHPRQRLRIGAGKLDELETVEADRVVAGGHDAVHSCRLGTRAGFYQRLWIEAKAALRPGSDLLTSPS